MKLKKFLHKSLSTRLLKNGIHSLLLSKLMPKGVLISSTMCDAYISTLLVSRSYLRY